jgi:hypothetical protein
MDNLCIAFTQKGTRCKYQAKTFGKCNKHNIITFNFNILPMEIKLMIINYLDYYTLIEFIQISKYNLDLCINLFDDNNEIKKFTFFKTLDNLDKLCLNSAHFIRPFLDEIPLLRCNIYYKRRYYTMKIMKEINRFSSRLDNNKLNLFKLNKFETFKKVIDIYLTYLNINFFMNLEDDELSYYLLYWLEIKYNTIDIINFYAIMHIFIKLYKENYPFYNTIKLQYNLIHAVYNTNDDYHINLILSNTFNHDLDKFTEDDLVLEINKAIVINTFKLYQDGIIFS